MQKIQRLARFKLVMVLLLALALLKAYTGPLQAAANSSRYFPETNHSVSGQFLDY
jgi:hypothetical protein